MGILDLAKLKVEHQKEMMTYKKMHAAILKFNQMKKEARKQNQPFPLEDVHIDHMRSQVFLQVRKIKDIEEKMLEIRTSFSLSPFETLGLSMALISILTLAYVVL